MCIKGIMWTIMWVNYNNCLIAMAFTSSKVFVMEKNEALKGKYPKKVRKLSCCGALQCQVFNYAFINSSQFQVSATEYIIFLQIQLILYTSWLQSWLTLSNIMRTQWKWLSSSLDIPVQLGMDKYAIISFPWENVSYYPSANSNCISYIQESIHT